MNTRNDFSMNYLILTVRAPVPGATHACDPAEPRGGGGIRKRLQCSCGS
ncbi:hypothetical protein [Escherichia coli]|nr:hypothetical protein [Escherichia coli]